MSKSNAIEIPVLLSRYWQLRGSKTSTDTYDALAEMAHEVKNPLSVILCSIQNILSAGKIDDAFAQDLPMIQSSALRIKRLISAMLDNQKLRNGDVHPDPTPTDLREFIHEIESEARCLVRDTEVEVITDVGTGVPTLAMLDRDLTHRILDNLISNALKFTPKGHITIKLKRSYNRSSLEFYISDTGKGGWHHQI